MNQWTFYLQNNELISIHDTPENNLHMTLYNNDDDIALGLEGGLNDT